MRRVELSLALQTDKPLKMYGPLAALAESVGFDRVSVYNDLFFQPSWLPLLEIARQTSRVGLGPAAVNPFTSHPINLAANIALIDAASGGRAYLGLARGAWLDALGLEPGTPIQALREAFEVVRHLLRKSSQAYQGKVYSIEAGNSLQWDIVREDIPFLLGSWGIETIRRCLDMVDEIKLGGSANPTLFRQYRERIDGMAPDGDSAASRPGLVAGAVCVVDEDGMWARRAARRAVALYFPFAARLDATLGIEPELLNRIDNAAAEKDYAGLEGLINDEQLLRVAFAGTPGDIIQQTRALKEAGVDRVEFGTPHGRTPEQGIRLLGQAVLPELSQENS